MSKLILFDFECDAGHVHENLQRYDDNPMSPCPKCGLAAYRIISGTHLDPMMALDGAFTTAVDKWAKKQEQRTRIDNIDGPNLWMY